MTGQARPRGARAWLRDLAMGARFALAGGRQGWVRTVLTGVGVGLGVTVLLLGASIPSVIEQHDARQADRNDSLFVDQSERPGRSAHTVLSAKADTTYRDKDVHGRVLEAEGDSPARPPGVQQVPAPGELLVSPALKKLLDSEDGRELRERLDGRVTGTIGDDGLLGPEELAFYKGGDGLTPSESVDRYAAYGGESTAGPLSPVLLLLVVVACAVLGMPVAVFLATATRFGGDQRDKRLAALRLVGADGAMARRMAAGETCVGAVLGLLMGAGIFLVARQLVGGIVVFKFTVFPADVEPSPPITALIVLGVPVMAVVVTLLSMRALVIEPLGVVRQVTPRPRRLWWRVVPPVLGLGLLWPMAGAVSGRGAEVNEAQVIGGVVLLLSGIVLLLPWLVERIVGRLRGGTLSWQLAVRRLQLSSGSATRAVSGITIAIAGAIALQMLFAGVAEEATEIPGKDMAKDEVSFTGTAPMTMRQAASFERELKSSGGVREARTHLESYENVVGGGDKGTSVVVGDCAGLRRLAHIGDCREGQVFRVPYGKRDAYDKAPGPGGRIELGSFELDGDEGKGRPWTVPAATRTVEGRKVAGAPFSGILATPSALPPSRVAGLRLSGRAELDPSRSDAIERVRTAAFHASPTLSVLELGGDQMADGFTGVRRGILAASVGVLALIAASMIVSMLEQLRERKRQLAVLVAFGTPRSVLGVSVLWQTAVPVVLGLGMAVVFGGGLGWALLRMIGRPATGWGALLPAAGAGVGMVALVTLASLPALLRMMRPEGLRSE